MKNSTTDHISEEKFLEAYNKYPPNKWTVFAFRFFSLDISKEDKWLSNIVQAMLLLSFLAGFVGTISNFSRTYMICVLTPFVVILVTLVIFLLIAVIMKNLRIRKIRKYLGITLEEYEILSDSYLG